MRIACLQFAPILCNTEENVDRASKILEAASPQNLDLLVLPELAFTGHEPDCRCSSDMHAEVLHRLQLPFPPIDPPVP